MSRRVRWGRRVAICLLSAVALLSGAKLISYLWETGRAESRFDALAQQVHATRAPSVSRPQTSPGAVPAETEEPLSPLEELQAQNGDLAGWITVPGTRIDYPVMHTPDDPQRYLRRDFDRNYSISGTPFLDGACTLESDNLILWGHNMKSGTMFADLLRYQDPAFAAEHGVMIFSTPLETRNYVVVAAFRSEVDRDGDYFRWYGFRDFPDEKTFSSFAAGLRAKSLIPVPEDLAWGDSFLTMATCSYHDDNGRFVLVGRYTEESP